MDGAGGAVARTHRVDCSGSPVASTGRPPFAHETMLRIHFLQQWFGLSDAALFETRWPPTSLALSAEAHSDRVSILRFRHLLQQEHQLSIQILATVNSTLAALLLKSGTAIDAT